jgi:hypothetical protein
VEAAPGEQHLLDEPYNPAFDVISRDAVRTVLAGPPVSDGIVLRNLDGALTAAVWLGRHETQARRLAAQRLGRNQSRGCGLRSRLVVQ